MYKIKKDIEIMKDLYYGGKLFVVTKYISLY